MAGLLQEHLLDPRDVWVSQVSLTAEPGLHPNLQTNDAHLQAGDYTSGVVVGSMEPGLRALLQSQELQNVTQVRAMKEK